MKGGSNSLRVISPVNILQPAVLVSDIRRDSSSTWSSSQARQEEPLARRPPVMKETIPGNVLDQEDFLGRVGTTVSRYSVVSRGTLCLT